LEVFLEDSRDGVNRGASSPGCGREGVLGVGWQGRRRVDALTKSIFEFMSELAELALPFPDNVASGLEDGETDFAEAAAARAAFA
jgi:hypothetical protein